MSIFKWLSNIRYFNTYNNINHHNLISLELIKDSNLIIFSDGNNFLEIRKILNKKPNQKILLVIKNQNISKRLLKLINQNKYNKVKCCLFSWRAFGSYENTWKSHKSAFEMIDNATQEFKNENKNLYNFILEIFNDEKIEYALKKYLLKIIHKNVDIFFAYLTIKRFNNNIISLFKDIEKKYIDKLTNYNQEKIIFFKSLYRKKIYFKKYISNIFLCLIFLFYSFYSLFTVRKVVFQKIKYFLAIRVYKDGLFLDKRDYHIDWLINNKNLNKEEVLFISEDIISSEKRIQIKENRYNFTNVNLIRPTSTISLVSLIENITVIPIISIKNFYTFIKTKHKMFLLNSWINFIQWNAFTKTFNLKNYISYHDYSEKQIYRNIFLIKNNCLTSSYKHTHSETVFNYSKIDNYNNVIFGYNFFNIEFHWSYLSIDMAKKNRSMSIHLISTGPIWSSKELNFNYDNFDKLNYNSKNKNVALFSSSYGSIGCVNDLDAHLKFLNFIKTIATKYPTMNFFFKPKYNFKNYFPESKEMTNISFELQKLKNLIIINDIAPIILIKNSIVSISMSFSSPVIEALASYNKSYYVDLTNAYPESYFKKFKYLVANNEKDALTIFEYWLNIDEKNFEDFINSKFKIIFGKQYNENSSNLIRSKILHHDGR